MSALYDDSTNPPSQTKSIRVFWQVFFIGVLLLVAGLYLNLVNIMYATTGKQSSATITDLTIREETSNNGSRTSNNYYVHYYFDRQNNEQSVSSDFYYHHHVGDSIPIEYIN